MCQDVPGSMHPRQICGECVSGGLVGGESRRASGGEVPVEGRYILLQLWSTYELGRREREREREEEGH